MDNKENSTLVSKLISGGLGLGIVIGSLLIYSGCSTTNNKIYSSSNSNSGSNSGHYEHSKNIQKGHHRAYWVKD